MRFGVSLLLLIVVPALVLGVASRAMAARKPVATIALYGPPAATGYETHAGHRFACGVWTLKGGGYVEECIPVKSKRTPTKPKALPKHKVLPKPKGPLAA